MAADAARRRAAQRRARAQPTPTDATSLALHLPHTACRAAPAHIAKSCSRSSGFLRPAAARNKVRIVEATMFLSSALILLLSTAIVRGQSLPSSSRCDEREESGTANVRDADFFSIESG